MDGITIHHILDDSYMNIILVTGFVPLAGLPPKYLHDQKRLATYIGLEGTSLI